MIRLNKIILGIPILFFLLLGLNQLDFSVKAEEFFTTTSTTSIFDDTKDDTKTKPDKIIAKGVYLTAASAANQKKVTEIIKLIDTTELNAVVIDIKDYTGNILYDSQVPLARELKTIRPVINNLSDIIQQFHDEHIYVIARQTVFQDPMLAKAKPEWAIRTKRGTPWRDNLGLSWVDPSRQEVWEYNAALAKEAISLGFDEINFDYVRFPSDGNLRAAVYAVNNKSKSEIMRDFYGYISNELHDEPAWISLDFFGLTMEQHDGLGIGQRIADAVDVVDYISPMMYPSHYGAGYLGFANPAEHPKEIISNGLKKGIRLFNNKRAMVRPWIQAFHTGAYYSANKIRAQIDAVEKYPNGGWLLWNSSNRYTSAGLK